MKKHQTPPPPRLHRLYGEPKAEEHGSFLWGAKFYGTSSWCQPVTPEVMVHIAFLVERDNKGLAKRCARYRRYARFRRVSVAACLFALFAFGADMAYATPPLYTENAVAGDTTALKSSNIVNDMLGLI